ncbi:R3H domain-containing protein 4-like [Styela clava]
MGKLVPDNEIDGDSHQLIADICESPGSVNQEKLQKRKSHGRRPKNLDRVTLADVTATCTITSPNSKAKGKGKRRQNRLENVRYLLSLWNKEDEDDDSVMLDEPMETSFSKVVTDDESRKIWNEFSALSGEEQDEYLAFIGQSEKRRKEWSKIPTDVLKPSGNPAFRNDICDTTVHLEDLNNDESAVADACYRRIERRLRSALNNKHIPIGMLEKLETDLTNFFLKWPSSKYTSVLSSSYERLLMHALCQYLGLISQSITCMDGHRCTEVQTKTQSSFHPPTISLCKYISERL